MSLPRPLDDNNKTNLNLSETCPVQSDHLSFIALLKEDRRTYWTTHVGGNAQDYLKSIRFGATKVVVTGVSSSTNYPATLNGQAHHGSQDIVLSEFTLDGDLLWGTYVGGTGGDQPGNQGLALSMTEPGAEDMYVVGLTSSSFTVVEGPGWYDETLEPGIQGMIVRYSGSDHSVKWLTYVNGDDADYGSGWLEAAVCDPEGRLFVGGYSADPTFPYQEAWQLYSTNTEYGAWDAVLMCYSEEQQLLWSTRFGGDEAGTEGERIETICAANTGRFYVAGYTYTNFNDQTFFPFTDPVGDTDYFDPDYYPSGDGFLAAFCIEEFTSVADENRSPLASALQVAPGLFELVGLDDTRHNTRVFDATGRLIQAQTHPVKSRLLIDLTGEAVGVYVVQVDGIGSIKLHNDYR